MSHRIVAIVVLLLLVASSYGDEPTLLPASGTISDAPAPVVLITSREPQHLVSSDVEQILSNQLNSLTCQVDELQHRVAQLEGVADKSEQVFCRIHAIEMPLDVALQLQAELAKLGSQPANPPEAGRDRLATASVYGDVHPKIDRLLKQDRIRLMSEIEIAVSMGIEGRFKSGGEFPILVPTNQDKVKVEYKEFGTRCELLPRRVSDSRIHLDIEYEFSERDFDNAVNVAGMKIPGLTTIRVNPQVEMELGQTSVVALQKKEDSDVRVFMLLVTPTLVQQ